jgi:predicted ester cyclase
MTATQNKHLIRNRIDDLLADGDRVCALITINGRLTNEVDLLGVRLTPDRRAFSTRQAHIFRIATGKIAEHWAVRDDLSMLRQLRFRICPPPEPASTDSS